MTPTNTHIFNNKKTPSFRPPVALPLNRYLVQVDGIGGEFVIGGVPEKVAAYWNSQSDVDLGEYLVEQNGRMDLDVNGDRIDPAFSTENWRECDNVSHLRGPVFDRGMTVDVEPEEGASVFSKSAAHRSLRGSIVGVDTINTDPSTFCLMARSGKIVHQIFGLETADKFDVNLLTMRFKGWGALQVLDGLAYDGKDLPLLHRCHRPMDDDKPMVVFVPSRS